VSNFPPHHQHAIRKAQYIAAATFMLIGSSFEKPLWSIAYNHERDLLHQWGPVAFGLLLVPCLPFFDRFIYQLINYIFALFCSTKLKSKDLKVFAPSTIAEGKVVESPPRHSYESNTPVIDSYCELSLKIEHVLMNDCCDFAAVPQTCDAPLSAQSRNDLVEGAHNSSEFVAKFEQADPTQRFC